MASQDPHRSSLQVLIYRCLQRPSTPLRGEDARGAYTLWQAYALASLLQWAWLCSKGLKGKYYYDCYQLLEAALLALGCQDLVQLVSVQKRPIWHAQNACTAESLNAATHLSLKAGMPGILNMFSPDPLKIFYLVLHGPQSRQIRDHWAQTSRPCQWIQLSWAPAKYRP